MKIIYILATLVLLLHNTTAKAIVANNKTNLSYASAHLEILPLLDLKFPSSPDNLIFVHPPKAGGTNVVYVIDAFKQIKSKRFSVPRIEGRSPGLITTGWIGGLANLKEKCINNNNCNEYSFISGHFPYGVHKYLKKNFAYITLIRDPIEREISSVNFDYQRGYVTNEKQATTYLLKTMIDNPQTRMLAGEAYMSPVCSEKVLAIAKQNLDKHFVLVGVTDDTNGFIQALTSLLCLEPIAISRSQVTSDKLFKTLPKEISIALGNKHKYDVELYNYARKRWAHWKQKNIINEIPINKEQKILTILPDYATNHQATYMTTSEIQAYNLRNSDNVLIKIHQNHHGVERKR